MGLLRERLFFPDSRERLTLGKCEAKQIAVAWGEMKRSRGNDIDFKGNSTAGQIFEMKGFGDIIGMILLRPLLYRSHKQHYNIITSLYIQ